MPKKPAKKINKFKSNDLVFARVKGYAPWPAKIVETGAKYKVTFFGTGEIGMIKEEDLFNYEDNREAFKKKFCKRKNYQEALNEITKSWNNKKECETPLAKTKETPEKLSETEDPEPEEEGEEEEEENEISQEESVSEPIKTESKETLEHIEEKTPEEESITEDTKPVEDNEVIEKKPKGKRPLENTETESKAKRIKTDTEYSVTEQIDNSYLEDSTLKIEINGETFTAYTMAGLCRLKSEHEELLERNTKNIKEDECCFLDEKSVAILYEPSIHPVVFGIYITSHRPNNFDNIEEQLRWDIKVVKDMECTVANLKKQQKPVDIVMDDYFLCLADFEQLMSHLKIILEREDLPETKKEIIAKELCILKIIFALRENVPMEIKDEKCLERALDLLKLVQRKYEISFMSAMKHPVIADCFFSLTKYSAKTELQNKDIVGEIQEEARTILESIRDNIKHLSEKEFKNTFWKPYVKCVKTFQRALTINRFDFMAITSMEEYNLLLKTQNESTNSS